MLELAVVALVLVSALSSAGPAVVVDSRGAELVARNSGSVDSVPEQAASTNARIVATAPPRDMPRAYRVSGSSTWYAEVEKLAVVVSSLDVSRLSGHDRVTVLRAQEKLVSPPPTPLSFRRGGVVTHSASAEKSADRADRHRDSVEHCVARERLDDITITQKV